MQSLDWPNYAPPTQFVLRRLVDSNAVPVGQTDQQFGCARAAHGAAAGLRHKCPLGATSSGSCRFPERVKLAAESELREILEDEPDWVKLKKRMVAARNAFLKKCKGGTLRTQFHNLSGTATITGVGFYDKPHANGASQYGVELHPVLRFSSSDCQWVNCSNRGESG